MWQDKGLASHGLYTIRKKEKKMRYFWPKGENTGR